MLRIYFMSIFVWMVIYGITQANWLWLIAIPVYIVPSLCVWVKILFFNKK